MHGMSNRETAALLGKTEKLVEKHLTALYQRGFSRDTLHRLKRPAHVPQ
jgi:DNA-binding NarL/FixJ family response regulator